MLFTVRPLVDSDRNWVREFMIERWGDEIAVAHGTIYRPAELPGFVVIRNDKIAGLTTYHIANAACEIVTLDSLQERLEVGGALIEAVRDVAVRTGCQRLWMITTNDNTHALRFYQKRGFRLVALRTGAIDAARRIKPGIPWTGNDDIPIRDELELEISPLKAAVQRNEALR